MRPQRIPMDADEIDTVVTQILIGGRVTCYSILPADTHVVGQYTQDRDKATGIARALYTHLSLMDPTSALVEFLYQWDKEHPEGTWREDSGT